MPKEPFWLEHIKHTSEAYSSFLEWLAEEKAKIHNSYGKAKSWDDTLKLQAQEIALDNILALCRMSDRETRQQEEHRRTINQQ